MSTIAIIIATIIPLVFLYLIYTRDLYGTGAFRYVIYCFFWGAAAYVLAAYVNTWVEGTGLVTRLQVVRYTAPVAEEILKALILIYLVRRPQFTYFVDGAIYGFAIGIGFAVFENYQYIGNFPTEALGVAISRVLSTNLMHATASAIVGIAMGLSRFQRSSGRVVLLVIGLGIAMSLHIGFNTMTSQENVNILLVLIYAVSVGIGGMGMITLAIKRGLAEEKTWIQETLGAADRVTEEEAQVVYRLEDINQILAPLAERFGSKKAEQIERFLTIQARLGILRKTLEKLQDEKLKQDARKEMSELQQEMDIARREVGTYAMMYLRSIFPDDDDELWGQLSGAIDAHIAAHPTAPGGGLWAKLEQREQSAGDVSRRNG
ncbi:MAG: PrsW family glutamic-type intramembrane protease [Anaerolineae bacterium]|nr:PrsW family glutamic-type intramembrane protease [Anaerolineae bacterium]